MSARTQDSETSLLFWSLCRSKESRPPPPCPSPRPRRWRRSWVPTTTARALPRTWPAWGKCSRMPPRLACRTPFPKVWTNATAVSSPRSSLVYSSCTAVLWWCTLQNYARRHWESPPSKQQRWPAVLSNHHLMSLQKTVARSLVEQWPSVPFIYDLMSVKGWQVISGTVT